MPRVFVQISDLGQSLCFRLLILSESKLMNTKGKLTKKDAGDISIWPIMGANKKVVSKTENLIAVTQVVKLTILKTLVAD